MTVKASHTIDKSTWLRGPWVEEPDCIEWVDEASRLPCLILRNPEMGSLCGYVGVSPDHPAWGMHYRDLHQVKVHGGLTYSGVRPDGVEDGLRWFGFDCAHYGDSTGFASPLAAMMKGLMSGEYRDVTYVMDECADLAKLLENLK